MDPEESMKATTLESAVTETEKSVQSGKTPEKVGTTNNTSFTNPRTLVADYQSNPSSSGSEDSESDSDSSEDIPISNGRTKKPVSSECESSEDDVMDDVVGPIEEIKITVPPEDCQEAGKVKYIVETQVVVEPIDGLPPLDLDTILFLESGKVALGRVEDVFGPVTEPLYSVMFNSPKDIQDKGITVGTLVYYAPKTDHTSFVLVSDLIKMKGSDASWKHNREVPPEFQDFSDDEAEQQIRRGKNGQCEARGGKKRNPRRQVNNGQRNHFSPTRSPTGPRNWRPPLMNMPMYPTPNFFPNMAPPMFPGPPPRPHNSQFPPYNQNGPPPQTPQFPPYNQHGPPPQNSQFPPYNQNGPPPSSPNSPFPPYNQNGPPHHNSQFPPYNQNGPPLPPPNPQFCNQNAPPLPQPNSQFPFYNQIGPPHYLDPRGPPPPNQFNSQGPHPPNNYNPHHSTPNHYFS